MNKHFFTICARNYLGLATTLMGSLKKVHPDGKFTIWLLDYEPNLPVLEGVRFRDIKEIIHDKFIELMIRYNVVELASAVKPACLSQHLKENADIVLFLDPDIYVFEPLTDAITLLETHDIVLTPHVLRPILHDGKKPDDLDILKEGIYNLGFIAIRKSNAAEELLTWWWRWLQTHCYADVSMGVFTDQKWINMVPIFFPKTAILRHPGYNLAYWNLAERSLIETDETILVDGESLVFFHYSGFDPKEPTLLSKNQNRISVKEKTPLAKLLTFYAKKVMESGYKTYSQIPIPELRFDNGVVFDKVHRQLLIMAKQSGLPFYFKDILSTSSYSFYQWSNEVIAHENLFITRYLKMFFTLRKKLQINYPAKYENDMVGFLHWLKSSKIKTPTLTHAFEQSDYSLIQVWQAKYSMNYIGYLTAPISLGYGARTNLESLWLHGFNRINCVDVTNLTSFERSEKIPHLPISTIKKNDINIIHVNADSFPLVRKQLGERYFKNSYNIVMWSWETQAFPKEWGAMKGINEIWVLSKFAAQAISRVTSIPIVVIPYAIPRMKLKAEMTRPNLDFKFLFNLDYCSVLHRKNPQALIDAFRLAFKSTDPVRLIIKTINKEYALEAAEQLEMAAKDLRVSFINEPLSSQDHWDLMASCDCYVSLHRSEGLGLSMAEAMYMGKPVIATGWSGNLDFMNVSNSLLVKFSLVETKEDYPPYPAGTIWAEADIKHAAELMQQVYSSDELRHTLGMRAAFDISNQLNMHEVGKLMRDRLLFITHEKMYRQLALSKFRNMARRMWHLMLKLTPIKFHPILRHKLGRLRLLMIAS